MQEISIGSSMSQGILPSHHQAREYRLPSRIADFSAPRKWADARTSWEYAPTARRFQPESSASKDSGLTRQVAQQRGRRCLHRMADENFEPIRLNTKAPGGERVLKSFDDIGAFILMRVETNFRKLPWWQAVLKDLPQARFGARQKETHAAMRAALSEEGWLAE